MQLENWLGFCAIALLATATPGPAALLVSINSVSAGFRMSLLTALGNITGLFIMSAFSIAGLSAIVLHSAVAFTVVKILGAIYLIYLGINLWRKGICRIEIHSDKKHQSGGFKLYLQGVLVAITNPKAIVFTTSLFPQFISVSEPLLPQFFILVSSFMGLSFVCLFCYALLAQRAKLIKLRATVTNMLGKVFGSIFIGAGCLLVTQSTDVPSK